MPLGAGRLSATGALFGLNDTSGTLLSFRGWALHDEKTIAFSLQPLPPLDDFMEYAQAPRTRPALEIDGRPGFYAKLGWASRQVRLSAFYYDNRGDPEAVRPTLQWGWRTRFGQIAAQFRPDSRTTITSQAMAGSTLMGFPYPTLIWVDTRLRSAFLLATRRIGRATSVSARGEAFGTRGRGSVLTAQTNEDGWAATLAWRHAMGNHVSVLGELLHVDSTRNERVRIGLAPHQTQIIAQVSARVTL